MTIGFGSRSVALFEMVLDRHGKNDFVISMAGSPDIILVNGDAPGIVETVKKVQETQSIITVEISARECTEISSTFRLRNPVAPQSLVDALHAAKKIIAKRSIPPVVSKSIISGWITKKPPPVSLSSVDGGAEINHEEHKITHGAKKTAAPVKNTGVAKQQGVSHIKNPARQIEGEFGVPDGMAGHLRDIDLNDPAQLDYVYFNSDGFLYECLRGRMASVSRPDIFDLTIGDKNLVFDLVRNRWAGNLDGAALKRLCLGALPHPPVIRILHEFPSDIHVSRRDEAMSAHGERHHEQKIIPLKQTQRADFILAQIGLWCSRGRLPKDIGLDEKLSLKHWPNMPQLPHIEGAIQVAALWARNPCSLKEIIKITTLPQRNVFSFYAVCSILGLLARHGKAAAEEPSPARREVAAPGFMRRLLKNLWRHGDAG